MENGRNKLTLMLDDVDLRDLDLIAEAICKSREELVKEGIKSVINTYKGDEDNNVKKLIETDTHCRVSSIKRLKDISVWMASLMLPENVNIVSFPSWITVHSMNRKKKEIYCSADLSERTAGR